MEIDVEARRVSEDHAEQTAEEKTLAYASGSHYPATFALRAPVSINSPMFLNFSYRRSTSVAGFSRFSSRRALARYCSRL